MFGPFYKTEFFIGAGLGYHSNDARSVATSEVPGDPSTPRGASPFLVRSEGAEIGARTKIVPGLDSSVSLFYLHQDSELFFDGDTGTTVPGPPSARTGIEIHQQLSAGVLGSLRRRSRALARALHRLRYCARATLPLPCRISASADRQRARQLHATMHRGWSPRRASRSARRPAGSVRCAGAISVRVRLPRMASSSLPRLTRSTPG